MDSEDLDALRKELHNLRDKYAGPGPHLITGPQPGSRQWNADHDRMQEIREALGMELWQKTPGEVWSVERMPESAHRRCVERAHEAGKPVPRWNLRYYGIT